MKKESEFKEETLDKKRIIIFLIGILLIIGGYFGKIYFLDKKNPLEGLSEVGRVKGVSTKNNNPPDASNFIKNGIQEKIDAIKEEATGLNVKEVASSSPQIQKVINDLKTLENVPKNQAKETCKKMCDGL